MRELMAVVLLAAAASAGAGELEPAGVIPYASVKGDLEWAPRGHGLGDGSVKVWYRPSDGCFSPAANALGPVRQWLVDYRQDHRVDGVEVFCQSDAGGAVVALAEVASEGAGATTLHVFRAAPTGRHLQSPVFDAAAEAGTSPTAHRVEFALEGKEVSGVLLMEELTRHTEEETDRGSPAWARCRFYVLQNSGAAVTEWDALAVYRLTTPDARRFLMLAVHDGDSSDGALQLVRLGARVTLVTSMPYRWNLPPDLTGRKAGSALEDLEYVLSVFASLAADGQSAELFTSPDIQSHIEELTKRRDVKTPPPGGD